MHACHNLTENAESSSLRSDGAESNRAAPGSDQSTAAVPNRLPMAVQSEIVMAPPAALALITSESGSAPASGSLQQLKWVHTHQWV